MLQDQSPVLRRSNLTRDRGPFAELSRALKVTRRGVGGDTSCVVDMEPHVLSTIPYQPYKCLFPLAALLAPGVHSLHHLCSVTKTKE